MHSPLRTTISREVLHVREDFESATQNHHVVTFLAKQSGGYVVASRSYDNSQWLKEIERSVIQSLD